MVKGFLKRLVPVLSCLVILISCMVVPAAALSPSVNPETNEVKAYPYITGSMFYTVAENYDAETLYGSSYGLAQAIEPSYDPITTSYAYIYSAYHDNVEAGPENWIISQHCYITNDTAPHKRIHEVYSVRDNDVITDEYFPYAVTIKLDLFGGTWDRAYLNKAFYLHGRYTFITEGDIYVVGDNGELVTKHFNLQGTANGDQSVLFNSKLQELENSLGIQAGDLYLMDLEIKIPFGRQEQDLHISRLGGTIGQFGWPTTTNGVIIEYPISQSGQPYKPYLRTFLTNPNLITGEQECEHPSGTGGVFLEGGDITEFVTDAAGGFLDAKIFGYFSFGDILGIFIAVAVVMLLLKVFAGG